MNGLVIGGCTATTVGELIEHLEKFDPATPVIHRSCSDWAALRAFDVELITADSKKLVYRGGQVCDTYPEKQWGDEVPVFITAVTFPGN